MRKPIFLAALCLVSSGAVSHADVTWQHRARVSLGDGEPLVTFSLRNDWSGQNHRARLSFDASGVALYGGLPPAQARGTVDIIERLGDDRLVLALRNPQNTAYTNYVEEPYSTLQQRLRINFFEALDPKFAANAEPIPALTTEQRRRLGQELRAYTRPFAKAFSRQYFRALPNTRTISGLETRGFRYTSLSRVPGAGGQGDEWVRLSSEFWLATNQPGDEEIASFTTQANALKSGPKTVSMWLNEIIPILSEAAPEEAQAFSAALIGRQDEPGFGFKGTPVQFAVTLKVPSSAAMDMLGASDIRFQADLVSRSNAPIPARAFESPTTGTRTQIEPFLQIMRNAVKQGRDFLQNDLGRMM